MLHLRTPGIYFRSHLYNCVKLFLFISPTRTCVMCVCSSVNCRCPSQASFPRPACRPSSGAPCCTCQTAHWSRIAAPPRPTASTAALQRFTTSSPPKARRTGGSWTFRVPKQIWSPHLIHLQTAAMGPVQFWQMSQCWGMLCVMFVRIVCTLLNSGCVILQLLWG